MNSTKSSPARRFAPEILAPAGNMEMMRAAVENGADAIYFGVQEFNARLRADNFSIAELPETMSWLHERGVKGYITLNVLIFQDEIDEAAKLLQACSDSGVDAVLIQDLGLARLAKSLVPELPIHASTQMTLTCAESIATTDAWGMNLERVVTARELSRRELTLMSKHTSKEIEVFVHGALCVAYSGQCLTSEALGGRSANRGECAQACRLPYDLIVDGEHRDLGNLKYLLSPKDLAAYDDIADLIDIGIVSLKIEGRLKTPEYVAAAVQAYRSMVDQALAKSQPVLAPELLAQLESTFSRGFTGGYIHEVDHQTVVDGEFSSKRGAFIGEVLEIRKQTLLIKPQKALKLGDGLLLDSATAASTSNSKGEDRKANEQGGSIYEIFIKGKPVKSVEPGQVCEVAFGFGKIDFRRLATGARIWKTSDPRVESNLKASFAGEKIRYRRPITAHVVAHTGAPLVVTLTDWDGLSATAVDTESLAAAEKHPLTVETLQKQLERMGDTPFALQSVTADIAGAPMAPLSRLNNLRREAVDGLIATRRRIGRGRKSNPAAVAAIRTELSLARQTAPQPAFEVSVLCRSLEQVEAACSADVARIYTDFEDIRHHREAKAIAERSGRGIIPATIRIMKPGEAATVRKILQIESSAVLLRNIAGWHVLHSEAPEVELIGDYSLNVANDLTARLLLTQGFSLLTPSYDLNYEQLESLVSQFSPQHFEITAHQYMPMFHMEHCVFCRFLSNGTDSSNCGRPCEKHSVTLRDRKGYEHPLKADFACRNTVFNGVAQSAAEYLAGLTALGARKFRIDFLAEDASQVTRTVDLYHAVLSGRTDAQELWKTLQVESKLGVTRGSLDHEHVPGNEKLYKLSTRKPAHGQRDERI